MSKSNEDAVVLKLIEEVKQRKEEIEKAERSNWLTNMTYMENGKSVSLHIINKVDQLIDLAGQIILFKKCREEAAKMFDVACSYEWNNFKIEDWLSDIKTKITKIKIEEKKKKLEQLEARLDKIITPELRRKMELEAIQQELS